MGVTLTYPFSLANGTTADATQVMANFNAVVTVLANNVAASGANSDITSLTALASPIPIAGGRTQVYVANGASTGSANAQANASLSPGGYAFSAGQSILFNPGFTNTGAMTYAPNGLTARNVFKQTTAGPIALTGGEVVAGQWALLIDDGTQFELVNAFSALTSIGFGAETNVASASTTDLGAASPNFHLINVTGTTTITSFGSTASIALPIYIVKFAASLTLTNGAALVLPGAVNITTQANDYGLFEYLGSGNWRCVQYWPATQTGKFLVTSGSVSAATTLDITVPADAQEIEIEYFNYTGSVANEPLVQYKVGGTTVVASYVLTAINMVNATVGGGSNTGATSVSSASSPAAAPTQAFGMFKISGVQSGNNKNFYYDFNCPSTTATNTLQTLVRGSNTSNTGLVSDILITPSAGNFTFNYRVYKIK